ncbi:hypothetical protein OPT61_g7894 [Boeremia exigua]|uniref:Uncharacterized protein n=1 Tax=Boeremia exigua TaxID=749465 RepID=A0ACC2I0U4_9PLEO|nr:hypothetical protein OPT61_g7894 [Boeremia exigua]
MSNNNRSPRDTSSDHPKRYEQYLSGMIFDGSMFPSGRDSRAWGPRDPLDVVPPAGPYDEEDGDESWRVTNRGRYVYTGEAHVRHRLLDAEAQATLTDFWRRYDAGEVQIVDRTAQDRQGPEAVGLQQFPDVLPVPSAALRESATYVSSPANRLALQTPKSIQAARSGFVQTPKHLQANSLRQGQRPILPAPVPRVHFAPQVGVEHKADDDNTSGATRHPSILTDSGDQEQPPDSSTPKASSPEDVGNWNDDTLLKFWKLKAIRKKGYEPMLAQFPGQTLRSLSQAWKVYRGRCGELGAAWRAAGKPEGPVADWLREVAVPSAAMLIPLLPPTLVDPSVPFVIPKSPPRFCALPSLPSVIPASSENCSASFVAWTPSDFFPPSAGFSPLAAAASASASARAASPSARPG